MYIVRQKMHVLRPESVHFKAKRARLKTDVLLLKTEKWTF